MVDVPSGQLDWGSRYDQILMSRTGCSGVRLGEKWGFVDKDGKELVAPKYDEIGDFHWRFAAIRIGDKWGFVGEDGNEIVSPKYDKVGHFDYYVADVVINGKSGVVDSTGAEVISPIYDKLSFLNREACRVMVCLDDKWGIVIGGDNVVVPLVYDNLLKFSQDAVIVMVGDKWGIISNQGEVICEPMYDEIDKRGSLYFRVRIGDKWGLINNRGILLFDAKYDVLEPMGSEGFSKVCVGGKWGYVNHKGEEVVTVEYDKVGSFYRGFCSVCLGGKWGMINERGEVVMQLVYDMIERDIMRGVYVMVRGNRLEFFYLNLERVVDKNGKFIGVLELGDGGVVDENGESVKPIIFVAQGALGFRDGDLVYPGGEAVDSTGDEDSPETVVKEVAADVEGIKAPLVDEVVVEVEEPVVGETDWRAKYDEIEDTYEKGLVKVKLGDKYGLVNVQTGKEVVPVLYDAVSDESCYMNDDLWGVELGGNIGAVNVVSGVEIIPPIYYSGIGYRDGCAMVKLDGKLGLLRLPDGAEIFDTIYDDLEYYGKVVTLKLNDKWGVGDIETGKVIVPIDYHRVEYIDGKGYLAWPIIIPLFMHYYNLVGQRIKSFKIPELVANKPKPAVSRRGMFAVGVLAGAFGVVAAVGGDSDNSEKPKVEDIRKDVDAPEQQQMPQYSPESVKLFSEIKLTTIQEALDKGYLVLNSQGKKVPAKGLDWKDDSKLDPQNSDTWVLVKVYGGSAAFEGQTSVPDVYADDVAYDMSQVRPYTTIGIKDIAKAKSNGYIVNGRPAKGLDFIYSNPSKDNLGSLTLVRLP